MVDDTLYHDRRATVTARGLDLRMYPFHPLTAAHMNTPITRKPLEARLITENTVSCDPNSIWDTWRDA